MTTYLDDPELPGAEAPAEGPKREYRINTSRFRHALRDVSHRQLRLELATLSLIVAVAGALRLWDLGRIGLRGDESVYAGQAAILAGHGDFSRHFLLASRGNSNFLVFQGMLSVVYRVFGVGDVSARVLSAVLSTLIVPVVYLIGRQLYGRRAAAFAAGLVAISAYSVELGRLALLDSAATLFIALAVLFLIQWHRRGSVGWLALFTVTTAIAAQTKVTSVLLVVIFAAVVVASKLWRRFDRRSVVIVGIAGLLALTPAIIEVVGRAGTLSSFLGTSVQRSTPVPWTYYFSLLLGDSGAPFLALVCLGLIFTIARPRREDLVPWLWFAVFACFLAAYPLKAFNYVLPLIPAVALLAGRGLASIRVPRVHRFVLSGAFVLVAVIGSVPFLAPSRSDDASVGMREAAYWLRDNAPADAGVMTMSHGSAQYVLSFYSNIDAYPFGRFRLATVMPGGDIISSKPTPRGKLPLDWISKWPPRLMRDKTVSYFVYSTETLDDTIEGNGASKSLTQRQFRSFIESYGGVLVHTVYRGHRPRAFIYKATKTEARPEVTYTVVNKTVRLSGTGFAPNSPVNLSYHGAAIATARSNDRGDVHLAEFAMPTQPQSRYYFVLSDGEGNTASANGLPSPSLSFLEAKGKLYLTGQHYAPSAQVSISYHNEPLTTATSGADGTFRTQVPYPSKSRPRYRLRATDSAGGTAWTTGVPAPSMQVSVRKGSVRIIGANFVPAGTVTVSYHGQTVARPTTTPEGTFTATFPLPSFTRPSFELTAVDKVGRKVRLSGLGPKGLTARAPTKGTP